MYQKRIFLIEDNLHIEFMERLFKQHRQKYELVTVLDLSDEGIFKKELPEGYDVYWMHSSSTEFDAIDKIRREQPWSKIIMRTGTVEKKIVQKFMDDHKIDGMIDKFKGTDERTVLNKLYGLGIDLIN